ncbi:2-hydroxychromene-2-carboxylate isomerase [Streptomyces collinus]|uniref:2-hydroxychromene-2-carboxylate isomerase n=1 Tax=Streptomyces collinus TaxID=42684 RepID=UPI00381D2CB1
MPRAARPPRFYFNLRSPYNFFALRALRAHRPELLDRLEWRPFWEPDETSGKLLAEAGAEFPYTPMSRAKQFYILRDVRRLATARGLDLTWPVDATPWWEPAHLTWFVAERHGLGQAWVERAGRARWLEGRDLCDPATVAELAAELGFEAADTDDPDLRAQGARALLDVVRDGVFGVPYFINGSEPYWGLDRVADFVASFDEPVDGSGEGPGPDAADLSVVAGRASDLSHAGGCG